MRIKIGKPQPSSKVPITIEDSPSTKGKESPSKTPITYESGTPRSSTWKEKAVLQDPKIFLHEAQTVLQETLSKLLETQKLEKRAKEETKGKDEIAETQEPHPQPSLGSYYNLLERGKIIPQKFTVPLFFALEEERVRTHTWMKIAKSKGVADIGPLEEQLKEA